MPDDISDEDLTLLLARAFDRAWNRYYQPGNLTLSRVIVRIELAKRLVQLSKEGVRDEGMLAQSGLDYLRELTIRAGTQE